MLDLRARFQNAKEAYSTQLASITKAILGLLGNGSRLQLP